jgi:hypothetical protein
MLLGAEEGQQVKKQELGLRWYHYLWPRFGNLTYICPELEVHYVRFCLLGPWCLWKKDDSVISAKILLSLLYGFTGDFEEKQQLGYARSDPNTLH